MTEPTYTTTAPPDGSGPNRLEMDLRILASQILAGDSEAYFLGLRLRSAPAIDGAIREFPDFTLGDFLRIQPESFLTGLSIYGTQKCDEATYTTPIFSRIGSLRMLTNYSAALDAIQSVKTTRLTPVHELCIKILRSTIKRNAAGAGA